LDHRKKCSAVKAYDKAVACLNKERERLTELQKRHGNIDVEGLLLAKAERFNLSELKEQALKEKNIYLKADKDCRITRNISCR